jgi:drug/metabolite transporter (DMT)-like permease
MESAGHSDSAHPTSRVHARRTDRSYIWGIVLLFAAAVLWSLGGAFINLIYQGGEGPHGVTIAMYRSLFAGLFLLPFTHRKWHTLRTAAGDRSAYAIRPAALACTIFFALMTACFVVANTMTQSANAIILQCTSTFWVYALSPWLLRERPSSGEIWIVALALSGIATIFVGSAGTGAAGLILALAAGLFFGLLTIMIRRLRNSNSAVVTVLNNLGSAVLLLPAAWWIGSLMVSPRAFALLAIMGVVQLGLPYYFYTLGLARVPAYQAALITMVEPILVPGWTYLAVGQKVPPATLAGGGVILLALLLFLRSAWSGRVIPMRTDDSVRS